LDEAPPINHQLYSELQSCAGAHTRRRNSQAVSVDTSWRNQAAWLLRRAISMPPSTPLCSSTRTTDFIGPARPAMHENVSTGNISPRLAYHLAASSPHRASDLPLTMRRRPAAKHFSYINPARRPFFREQRKA